MFNLNRRKNKKKKKQKILIIYTKMNDVEINKILADEEIAFTRHMTPNEYVKLIFNKQVYPVIYERICIREKSTYGTRRNCSTRIVVTAS
jgi:hypothetical protein